MAITGCLAVSYCLKTRSGVSYKHSAQQTTGETIKRFKMMVCPVQTKGQVEYWRLNFWLI